MATSRSRTTADPRPKAKVLPLPGLGATHSELAREAAVTRWTKVHGHDVAYRQAGSGPLLVMIHGIAGSSGTWVPVMPLLAEQLHGDRARPARPRRVGQAAGRLQPRRLRLRHPRPARRAGPRAGHGRRPQPRRRRRHAVRLPVPPDGRAARARLQRRARQGGQPPPAGAQPAGHRVRPPRGARPPDPQRGRVGRSGARPVRPPRRPVPRRGLERVEPPHRPPGPARLHPHDPRRDRRRRPARRAPATGSTSPTRCPR